MAKMNQQKAQGKRLCAVVLPVEVFTKLEDGEYGYVKAEIDLDDERTFKKCGKAKRSHSAGVKNPILDHPYGGEDGSLIEIKFPTCGVCKKEIEKGEQYRYWAPRYGARHTRCMECPAPPRSALTSSEILSMAWDIADGSIESGDVKEDFESARDEYAERVQEIVDLIQEKMDNIESGFGHTSVPVYEELEERLAMYEDWQQEIEGLDFDDFSEESEACSECSLSESDHFPNDEDHEWTADAEFDAQAALDALSEAVSNAPE